MKILIMGASGLLGATVVRRAVEQGHAVVGTFHRGTASPALGGEWVNVDLADAQATEAVLKSTDAEAIVNCAAIASIPECERAPERAYRLNVGLPAQLAEHATRAGMRFIHVSSEQVFDGAGATAYMAGSPVSPLNVYGRQKVESEIRVGAAAPRQAVTIRPPLMLGNSITGTRGLHEQLLTAWSLGQTPVLFADEYRQPCSVDSLTAAVIALCERREVLGVVHWSGGEMVSRHALACRVREYFRLAESQAPLAMRRRADLPELACARPRRLQLDGRPLAEALDLQVESLADTLATLRVPTQLIPWHRRSTAA